MLHTAKFRMFAFVMILLALTLGQSMPALAQGSGDGPADEQTAEEEAQQVEEKDPAAPGDSSAVDTGSSLDAGTNHLYVPSVSGGTAQAQSAAVDATIFTDEFCSFPNGWSRSDYDPTAPVYGWVRATVLGRCVARPNAYVNGMQIHMTRSFSTIGGNIAGANVTFRFRMNTESNFDYLRYEFSCNSNKTWRGGVTIADSGAFGGGGFVSRTISLAPNCDESSSVRLRFWFQTDSTVIGAERPSLDSVTVTD